MKYAVLVALLFLLPPTNVFSQDDWDVTGTTPPSTGNTKPMKKPVLSIKPFKLLVFEVCEPNRDGYLASTGKLGITVLSEYGSVGFYPHATDTSLTLKLKTQGQGEKQESFRVPHGSFTLFVILGNDTAEFFVEKEESLSVTYLKKSPILLLEDAMSISGDMIPMQMMPGSTQKTAKQFVKELRTKFGDGITIDQLKAGFYPCLPVPFVEPARIGRGGGTLQINRTSQGLLLCIRAVNEVERQEIADWIYQQQKEELQRYRAERR